MLAHKITEPEAFKSLRPSFNGTTIAFTKTIGFTNGCFDLLHCGHVQFLEEVKNLCDVLVVGINSDESVRALKGLSRPLNPLASRMLVLAGLASVDYVLPMYSVRNCNLLKTVQPHLWAKGGDYTLDSLDPDEKATAASLNTRIVIIPIQHPVSTSQLLTKILS